MKDDTGENVEFAIKLQDGILVPVDSHFPIEKSLRLFKMLTKKMTKKQYLMQEQNLQELSKIKQKSVMEKYIVPPKTVNFAIIYAPTESLFLELS